MSEIDETDETTAAEGDETEADDGEGLSDFLRSTLEQFESAGHDMEAAAAKLPPDLAKVVRFLSRGLLHPSKEFVLAAATVVEELEARIAELADEDQEDDGASLDDSYEVPRRLLLDVYRTLVGLSEWADRVARKSPPGEALDEAETRRAGAAAIATALVTEVDSDLPVMAFEADKELDLS